MLVSTNGGASWGEHQRRQFSPSTTAIGTAPVSKIIVDKATVDPPRPRL